MRKPALSMNIFIFHVIDSETGSEGYQIEMTSTISSVIIRVFMYI